MKLIWLTDVHLNFLDKEERILFYKNIKAHKADAALLTGDIAEAPTICKILSEFSENVEMKTYFVLGNHDYYRGSVEQVKEEVSTLTKQNSNLIWLSERKIEKLNDGSLLIGQDAWADGRNGDYFHSPVRLNDSRMIIDLYHKAILGPGQLLSKMQELADHDAMLLKDTIAQALEQKPKTLYIAFHVPPFREACWHEGKPSDDNWVPYFSCKATGDVLDQAAKDNPMVQFTVLCGHTHTAHTYQHSKNLLIRVGGAQYYYPTAEDVIDVI